MNEDWANKKITLPILLLALRNFLIILIVLTILWVAMLTLGAWAWEFSFGVVSWARGAYPW
jgi:hypothetical protein